MWFSASCYIKFLVPFLFGAIFKLVWPSRKTTQVSQTKKTRQVVRWPVVPRGAGVPGGGDGETGKSCRASGGGRIAGSGLSATCAELILLRQHVCCDRADIEKPKQPHSVFWRGWDGCGRAQQDKLLAGGEREVLPAAGLQQDDAQRPVEGSTGGLGDVYNVLTCVKLSSNSPFTWFVFYKCTTE